MSKRTSSFAALSGFQILAVIVLMGSEVVLAQQKPPSAPVTIVNQTANPVPTTITGTASVSGDVNAQQAGSWTVNIGNIPSVEAQQSGAWKFAIDPLQNTVQDAGANTRLDTANSHLANIETATSQFKFDGSGNLKTAPQGTQNVNIVSGTINSVPAVASKREFVADTIDPGGSQIYPLDSVVNTSIILITTDNDIDVDFDPAFPNSSSVSLGHITGGQLVVINLTQQIPISGFVVSNHALLAHARFAINVLGN